MRRMAPIFVAFGLLLGLALTVQSGEGDAAAIVAKAFKAHFPKGTDKKEKATRSKSKGTLHIQGLDLEFTQDVAVQSPKFKETMEMTIMNKKISVTSVYDGKKAWIRADDKDVPVNDDILAAFKEVAYTMSLMEGAFAKDKSIKYSVVGEVKVKNKAAIGVTLSREGKKDINLFFDKGNHLIVKVEMRTRDIQSGMEVTEERYITEYQDVRGYKVAKKLEVQRDGKALMEAEVTEVQFLEKIDDSEFAQPK